MRSPTVTPQRQRSAAQAARDPARVLTTLAHLIEVDLLREASRHPSTARAPGSDGVTAPQYAAHLDENLHDWPERLRSGRYQARPVERVWIEKEDGKQRPIGPPTCEDKMVHRAMAMLLAAIDEHDFADGSYGFRRGRRPHDALDELRERCRRDTIGWIVDAEVRGDCDRLDRRRLRAVLRQRVKDGSLLRLMGKWLRAGVMEAGRGSHPETGGVQGGVMAPVLAHICLHHVLDEWFEQEGQPRLQGRGFLLRLADDCVLGCALQADAHRMMAGLPKRCARDGLPMHPTQTAWMAFSKPEAPQGSTEGNGTGDVLGWTHDWTRSRRGYGVIKRRTAHKRLRRTTKSLWRWCRSNRHTPLSYQYQQ